MSLTFEIDFDVVLRRNGDVVVLGLAAQLGAEIPPGHLVQGQGVLHGFAERGLVGRVNEATVAPPGHLGPGIS